MNMARGAHFRIWASILCLPGATLAGQNQIGANISADEVKVRSAPYWPLSPASIIRTQLDLVEVPVVVRDGKGVAVSGLKRENFEILDAGKKREITNKPDGKDVLSQ